MRNSDFHCGLRDLCGVSGRSRSVCGVLGVCGGLSKKFDTPVVGRCGDSGAPAPATLSTSPVVVVILKNESIIVVFLVVMLVGGDSIVDFGNRTLTCKGLNPDGGVLVMDGSGLKNFPLEQQSS